MPKDVQMLLVDPTDHLKQFMKNTDFQGKHKFHLLGFKQQNLEKIKSDIKEINSKIHLIQQELQNKQDMYNNMKSQIQKLKETVNALTTSSKSRSNTSETWQDYEAKKKRPIELTSPVDLARESPCTSLPSSREASQFYYKTPASWNLGAARPQQSNNISKMWQNGNNSLLQNMGRVNSKQGELLKKNHNFFTPSKF